MLQVTTPAPSRPGAAARRRVGVALPRYLGSPVAGWPTHGFIRGPPPVAINHQSFQILQSSMLVHWGTKGGNAMQLRVFAAWAMVAPLSVLPTVTDAQTVSNPSTAPGCMNNTAFFNTNTTPSINLPAGFTTSVFASGLNMPTGI